MDEIRMNLLKEVADLDALPVGAYNIRENGKAAGHSPRNQKRECPHPGHYFPDRPHGPCV